MWREGEGKHGEKKQERQRDGHERCERKRKMWCLRESDAHNDECVVFSVCLLPSVLTRCTPCGLLTAICCLCPGPADRVLNQYLGIYRRSMRPTRDPVAGCA